MLTGTAPFDELPPVDQSTRQRVTLLLQQRCGGDPKVMEELMPLVYDELRRMAGRFMAQEKSDHTLQATALVNEAYFRLVDQKQVNWQNRKHFMGIVGQMMRRILVDHARAKYAGKRGGREKVQVTLDKAVNLADAQAPDLIALDDALEALGLEHPRQKQVVELRYFAGLDIDETAKVLETSPATVKRDWTMAKAWLFRALNA